MNAFRICYDNGGILIRGKLIEQSPLGPVFYFCNKYQGAGIRFIRDPSKLVEDSENAITAFYKRTYPHGTMLKVIAMPDDPRPIPKGTVGIVISVDDIGTLHCNFDNGRHLGLVPGVDKFLKIDSTVYF